MKLLKNLALSLFIIVFIVGCDSATDRQSKYFNKAEESFKNNNFELARVNYNNVLAINPENAEAKYGLARTFEKLKNWRQAFSQYKGVIQIEPEHVPAKLKLGQLYLLAKKPDLALSEAEDILHNDSVNAVAMAIKAGALFQKGQLSEAILLAENAYEIDENDIDVLVMLVSLYRANQDSENALVLLENDIKNNSNRPSLRVLLSEMYLIRGDIEKAENQYKILIKNNPDTMVYKKALISLYEKQDKLDKAEGILKGILDDDPANTEAVLAYAQFILRHQGYSQAIDHLDFYIKIQADEYDLLFAKASLLEANERENDAIEIYKFIIEKDDTAALKSKSKLAVIAFNSKNPEEGHKLLEEVLIENPADFDALFIRATIALKSGNSESAIIDLRQILDAKPDSVQVITLLGKAYVMNNQLELAAQTYTSALNYSPNDQLRIQISKIYEDLDLFNKANKHLFIVSKNNPKNIELKLQIIKNHFKLKNIDQAIAILDELAISIEDNSIINYYYGLAYQNKNDHPRAIFYFDKSLQASPGSTEPMTGKVRSMIKLNQLDKAVAWLDSITKDNKDNVVAYNIKGEILLSQSFYDKAIDSFDTAISYKPEWWMPYRNKAKALELKGQKQLAIKTLLNGIDKAETPGLLQLELAQHYQKDNKIDQAISVYEDILKGTKNSELAANNLAALLINHRKDEKSLKRALELTKIIEQSANPFYRDTVGWTYYVNGQYKKSLDALLFADSKLPNLNVIQYHLGMAYYNLNDMDSALAYLQSSLESDEMYQGRDQAEITLKKLKQNS